MDNKELKKQWTKLCPAIKQKWPKFSDQEINQINGDKTLFLNHLQKKYGIDRNVAEKELEQFVCTEVQTSGASGRQSSK